MHFFTHSGTRMTPKPRRNHNNRVSNVMFSTPNAARCIARRGSGIHLARKGPQGGGQSVPEALALQDNVLPSSSQKSVASHASCTAIAGDNAAGKCTTPAACHLAQKGQPGRGFCFVSQCISFLGIIFFRPPGNYLKQPARIDAERF